jgi:hypothetical protein
MVATAACSGAGACGGHSRPDEISSDEISSDEISSEDIARDLEREQRLGRLEHRVDLLKRENKRKPAPAAPAADDGDGLAGLDSLGPEFDGEVGVAVGPAGGGQALTAGSLTSGSAWSTIKVPIALAVLSEVGGPARVSAAQRTQIERAITASDNAAAAQLFEELGRRHGGVAGAAAAVTNVLRASGDDATVVSTQGRDGFSPYGQTEWSLAAQQRFMAGMVGGCVGDAGSTRYLLELMGQVTSDTWGLGSVGVPARWKGGWGPGLDGRYLVRQMGVVEHKGKQLVVSIAARSNDGQFATSQAIATRLAQRVIEGVGAFAGASGGC